MTEVVLLSACRTAIGRFQGSLAGFRAPELGAIAVREAVKRAGIEASAVQEVILGNVLQAGVGQNPARQAARGAGIPNVATHVRNARLRILAVTTVTRWPELPEVPAVAEAGVPGYEAALWVALLAPAATPAGIVERLYAEIGKALQQDDVQQSLRAAGLVPALLGPPALGAFLRTEHEKWGRVVRETGATIN